MSISKDDIESANAEYGHLRYKYDENDEDTLSELF
jgi:hypothetical protein